MRHSLPDLLSVRRPDGALLSPHCRSILSPNSCLPPSARPQHFLPPSAGGLRGQSCLPPKAAANMEVGLLLAVLQGWGCLQLRCLLHRREGAGGSPQDLWALPPRKRLPGLALGDEEVAGDPLRSGGERCASSANFRVVLQKWWEEPGGPGQHEASPSPFPGKPGGWHLCLQNPHRCPGSG